MRRYIVELRRHVHQLRDHTRAHPDVGVRVESRAYELHTEAQWEFVEDALDCAQMLVRDERIRAAHRCLVTIGAEWLIGELTHYRDSCVITPMRD